MFFTSATSRIRAVRPARMRLLVLLLAALVAMYVDPCRALVHGRTGNAIHDHTRAERDAKTAKAGELLPGRPKALPKALPKAREEPPPPFKLPKTAKVVGKVGKASAADAGNRMSEGVLACALLGVNF